MRVFALAAFALAYSGVVLFALAHALRRLYPRRRAALTAFGISAVVHGATPFLADPERWIPLTLFWLGPHLLILPLLLWSADQQGPGCRVDETRQRSGQDAG